VTSSDLDVQGNDVTLADAIAERALSCPAVISLAGGVVGQVATYLPGRRVVGVSLDDDVCEVAVVLRLGADPLPVLADQVRQAVAPVAGSRAVHVLVDDVLLPGEDLSDEARDDATYPG
jgi:hypothetical protein